MSKVLASGCSLFRNHIIRLCHGQLTFLLATSLLVLQMSAYVMGFYRSRYVMSFEVTIISNLALYSLAKQLYTGQMEPETIILPTCSM